MGKDDLSVRTHVARDLLQNAALFKTDKLVVWEYVSNSLQYIDPGTVPVVFVRLDSRNHRIEIEDNGAGMDWEGLHGFFVMHGENVERLKGRPGRGRFGTGKCAAFGIAEVLRVTTVRKQQLSKVELRRKDVDQTRSGDPVPVRTLVKEEISERPNGTLVEIENVHLKTLDQVGMIRYIERHLARWPKNASVFVNNHPCEYAEPPVAYSREYEAPPATRDVIGDVRLVLKVAKVPLDEDERGVSIYANGVWYETTLAGNEGRDMANYVFGEVDVPLLDSDESPLAPFDLSRSMRLNPANPIVQCLNAFIGKRVDEVRRELVEKDRERRAEEEAKRLSKQAKAIEEALNADFDSFRSKIAKVRALRGGTVDVGTGVDTGGDSSDILAPGDALAGTLVSPFGTPGHADGQSSGGDQPPLAGSSIEPNPDGEAKGKPSSGDRHRRSMIGGFRVLFDHMGVESHRALYEREGRTIYVNLDHPQVATAKASQGMESPAFRWLVCETAFCEYAIALASELAQRNEYLDFTDPLFDIRDTVDRLSRRAAVAYSS